MIVWYHYHHKKCESRICHASTESLSYFISQYPIIYLSIWKISVLSKGLNFVPLERSFDEFTVLRDVDAFFRRLRLKAHFQDPENSRPQSTDPFVDLQQRSSNWSPKSGENKVLDKMIDNTRKELEQHFKPKPIKSHNLTTDRNVLPWYLWRKEMTWLSSLLTRVVPSLFGGKTCMLQKRSVNFRIQNAILK